MGFKIHYRQNVSDGQSTPVSQDYTIDTFDSVWEISPLNSAWVNSGCYAGATPANGSEIGSYSVASWSGWNENTVNSDMRDMTIRPYQGSSQQNLRFMAKYNSAGFFVNKQSFNWTNLRDDTVRVISDGISSLTSYQEYDPYRRDNKSVWAAGDNNSPLNVAPLESLKINQLVFVPVFKVKEIEYYGYDDVSGGYANVSSSSNTTSYTWAQIKPQDKTPAGEFYDADLFENGWKEITPTQEDGRRFRFCCGVMLVPYYGACSNSYNPTTDDYTAGVNPDDGNVYGSREVFGSVVSQTGEYPVIGNTTNLSRPCLMVMTENYDSNTGGIVYSLPAGLSFGNMNSTGSVSGNLHALQPSWKITSDFHRFVATTSWVSNFYTGNQNYANFYADADPSAPVSPSLSITSSVLDIDINISALYNITDLPSTNKHYLVGNGPNSFSFEKSDRSITATETSFFSISSLWHTIASLGCYVADDTNTAQKAPTGAYTGENNHLYLGYMDASGITNGTMLQGGDIINSTQAGIDDIIQNTPYTPVEPGPSPDPGGDDPDDPSRPKDDTGNVGLNDISNLSIGGVSSFLTGWVLNDQQIINLARRLWSTINSNNEEDAKAMLSNFYRIQHRTYDPDNPDDQPVDYELSLAEIPDYFVGLKWFPFDVSSNFSTISSGESGIRVGTGASLISTGNAGGTQFLQGATAQLNGGTITVPYTYESYLDLEPYTSATIYIPYCGTTSIQPSLIMGRTLTITYAISGLTGSICAIVMVSSGSIQYPLCVMNGMCGFDIAISGNTQNAQIRNALTARDNYYMGQWQTISGGMANIGKVGAISSVLGNYSDGYDSGVSMENARNFFTDVKEHGWNKALQDAKAYNAGIYNTGVSAVAGFGMGAAIAKPVADMVGSKIAYENQLPFTMGTQPLVVGSSSSMANLILPQSAFVQIRRKNRHELGQQAYGNTYGYESKNTKRIGELTGFIKCVNPKISIAGALQSEMEEIYGLLSTGIYRN